MPSPPPSSTAAEPAEADDLALPDQRVVRVERARSRPLIAVMWAATLVLAASTWLAAVALSERDQNDALARAQRDSANLAQIIAEQTTRAISGTDRILSFIGYDLYRLGGNSPLLRDVMKSATLDSDLLLQLAYADGTGDLIQTSVDGAPAAVNLSDREHFRVHKENKVTGLFISRPVFGRASGKWSIQLSRKVTAPDGGFGGMIVASLDPFYFSRTFDDLDVGAHGVVSIFGTDGVLRARNVLDEKIIGQDLSKSTVFKAAQEKPMGFLRTTSSIDGVTRLVSYRALANYPLIVAAGFAEADFMAETWARQQAYITGAAGASLLLLVMAVLVTWQYRNQERANAALDDAARRLRTSKQKLRDIAETASDWFWEMDADLRFTSISGAINGQARDQTAFLGRRRDEIARREPGDEAAWAEHQRLLDAREPFRNFEFSIVGPEGDTRIWAVSGRPVFDDAGRFQGYRGSGSDVTDRRHAERSLAASEQRYRAMFEAVGQPVITTDQDGRILGFNPAAERLLGYRPDEVAGQDIAVLMPEPYRSSHRGFVHAYRDSGRSVPVMGARQLTIQRQDGTVVPVEIALSSWRSDGQEHFIGILRDITQAKQIEDSLRQARDSAEHANRMKSEFLATISHEIRTPMNGVLGTLTLLGDEALTPEQKRLATVARRSAESLLRLLDDILDFSKLEAGRITLDETDCDPAQVAETVLEVFQPKAEEKGLTLSVRMLPSVPDAVVTDPARLRQILFNLVGNAIKFTAKGHVAVRGRRGADLPDGRFRLDFEVEDTGIGIPPETASRLFKRFTQADSSITRRYGGTGLGLAICKELCAVMGGEISVSSAPGKGSVFQFSIVCGLGDPATMRAPVAHPANALSPVLPPLRVLAVDDNEVNRDIVRSMLLRAGHAVDTACDGGEAVCLAGEGDYDLILMDVQMPEVDGLVATRLIRGLAGPRSRVPVVALTAHASGSSRPECLEAGMDGFVTKPVRPAALFQEMATVLAAHRAGAPSVAASSAPAAVDPPAADDAVAPVLDPDQVSTIVDILGEGGWTSMLEGFANAAREQAAAIRAALTEGKEHHRAAHTLKGLAWNVGAKRLGDAALAIERAATPEDALRRAADLEAILAQTLDAFAAC